jgi:regulatory protein
MTRRARSGRGWDAAPPRAPRRRRASSEDSDQRPSEVSATGPEDDLWEGDAGWEGDRPEAGRSGRGEKVSLPWSLDDMRRTGNRTPGLPALNEPPPGSGQAAGHGGRGQDQNTPRRARRTRAEPSEPAPRDQREWAREICLRLLSGRPRTRAELAKALAKRGIAAEVVAEVLDRYDEVGIIDDAAFARAWVESRHHGKGLARRALGQELRRRGVEQEHIQDALAELEVETEEVTARELVERKLRTTRGEPDAIFRKLVGMLARKGYPPGIAVRAVKDVLEQKDIEQGVSPGRMLEWMDDFEQAADEAEGDRPDRV